MPDLRALLTVCRTVELHHLCAPSGLTPRIAFRIQSGLGVRRLHAPAPEAGCESFATKLGNASKYLYAFILHPGMEPTNNLAECMPRPSVIARNIFQGLRTEKGVEMFTVLTTCAMNWRARGCGVREVAVKTPTGSVA